MLVDQRHAPLLRHHEFDVRVVGLELDSVAGPSPSTKVDVCRLIRSLVIVVSG